MKNFYKKLISIFSTSFFSLISLKNSESLGEINKLIACGAPSLKILPNKTTKEETLDTKTLTNKKMNPELKQFIDELNQRKIYLLTTDSIQSNKQDRILLLLHTQDRLKSEQSVMDDRHLKVLFKTTNDPFKKYLQIKTLLEEFLNPESPWYDGKAGDIMAQSLCTGKSFYVNNLGGYKSICPVFFDKETAEDFLMHTSKRALSLLKYLPKESSKEIYKGLINTKIYTVGLGDFISFYCDENKSALQKVEFLFVPCLQNPDYISNIKEEKIEYIKKSQEINRLLRRNNFKAYQKQFYEIKNSEKTKKK
jgi:hypothetical protein